MFNEDFYTSPSLGLTEVLTVLQCSLRSPYTHDIFPMASRFLHQTGLPTHRSAYRFTYLASPIGPNRSGPRLAQAIQLIQPMLSLSLNNMQLDNGTRSSTTSSSWSTSPRAMKTIVSSPKQLKMGLPSSSSFTWMTCYSLVGMPETSSNLFGNYG